MSALTEARKPILLQPVSKIEPESVETRRVSRNGWIVVLLAAIVLAILLGFATRGDPEILAHMDQTSLME